MKSVIELKSIKDMRTTISTHVRSTPPKKDSTYLDVYLLGKEKQRLGAEISLLLKRQMRIEGRLGEIREAMEKLLSEVEQEKSPTSPPSVSSAGASPKRNSPSTNLQKWSKLTVEY